mmetsp:Transcript_116919/g.212744  ORF Transcript_116919/g.212744 Transcript_116919/m.212744 type:complete len:110 (-) Transcript_116919:601-930(-)
MCIRVCDGGQNLDIKKSTTLKKHNDAQSPSCIRSMLRAGPFLALTNGTKSSDSMTKSEQFAAEQATAQGMYSSYGTSFVSWHIISVSSLQHRGRTRMQDQSEFATACTP